MNGHTKNFTKFGNLTFLRLIEFIYNHLFFLYLTYYPMFYCMISIKYHFIYNIVIYFRSVNLSAKLRRKAFILKVSKLLMSDFFL